MNKILISDKLAEAGINFLTEQSDIQVHIKTGLNEDQLCEIIGDYDALLIRSDTKVTEKVLNAASRLKIVGRAGIGVDNVDIPCATEHGVIVMNTPDANATTTAELALAHILSLSRNLPMADRSIRDGKWERSKLVGSELAHKTLAILGFGTIGRILSSRAKGLNMRVIAYDPFVTDDVFESLGIEPVDLNGLVTQADYISLHCPMNDKTRGIIGVEQLKQMKSTARIINCARGGLIDEAALYDALKNGTIAGAALDVYENEPPKDSPLLELDNIVFTPHLGASTSEAQVAVSVEIARQVVDYLKTGVAVNALNLPRLSADELNKLAPFTGLANSLGAVLSGLASEPIQEVEIALFGRAAEVSMHPLSIEVLIGLLSGKLSSPVNHVNAEDFAKRQGITIVESRTEKTYDYVSLIQITGKFGNQKLCLAGTLLGGCDPRLVKIDDIEIEVVPEGTLLITRHQDRPGVVADLGTVLGNANINITRMQVGIADNSNEAMAVIGVSAPLSDELLEQVQKLDAVCKVSQVTL